MTGYGKDEFKLHGTQCTVEVRSVNNRFLEISCHLPKTFSYLEFALKEEVKKFLARGSVNLTVTFGDSEEGSVPTGYSTEAVEAYLKIANDIKTKYHLTGEPTLEQVLSLPNVLVYESEEDQKETEELIKASLDRALQSLVQMREKEGLNLKKDLEARVHEMDTILDEVKVLDPERIVEWKQKFEERLQKLVGEAGLVLEKEILCVLQLILCLHLPNPRLVHGLVQMPNEMVGVMADLGIGEQLFRYVNESLPHVHGDSLNGGTLDRGQVLLYQAWHSPQHGHLQRQSQSQYHHR